MNNIRNNFSKKSYNKNDKNDNEIKIKKKKKEKRNLRSCINKIVFDFLLDKIYTNPDETDENVLFNKILLNVLLYYTGLRINEVLLLNKKNIMNLINSGRLEVYCKKTQEHRTVFLQGSTRTKFMYHFTNINLNDKINKLGLTNKWNNELTHVTAFRWMTPYFDMLEDEYGGEVALLKGRAWGFHSYRVNYINQIIRSADIDTAAKIIGHKNIMTTLIYFRKLKTKESVITGIIDQSDF